MGKHLATLLWMSAAVAAVSLALPTNDKSGSENDLMANIYSDCLKKESISCIKYKVFTYVDKMLADKEDITLSEGITVVKTSNAEEGAPRSVLRLRNTCGVRASFARTCSKNVRNFERKKEREREGKEKRKYQAIEPCDRIAVANDSVEVDGLVEEVRPEASSRSTSVTRSRVLGGVRGTYYSCLLTDPSNPATWIRSCSIVSAGS